MSVVQVLALGLLYIASGCSIHSDVRECSAIDVDSDGHVSESEYEQAIALRDVFKLLDGDFSQTLTDFECMRAALPSCLSLNGMTYPEILDTRRTFYQKSDWKKNDPHHELFSRLIALMDE